MKINTTSLIHLISPGMFRLLLAILVMIFHSVSFLTIGHYAVYVFFILSGYWIAKMYVEKYSLFEKPFQTYLQSRFFRLFPVYWLILIIGILTKVWLSNFVNTDYSFAFKQPTLFLNFIVLGLLNTNFKFIVPAWSLDLELQFYLVAPVIVYSFVKRKGIFVIAILSLGTMFPLLSVQHLESYNLLGFLPWFVSGIAIYFFKIVFSDQIAILCLLAAGLILSINYCFPYLRVNFLLNKSASILSFNYQEFINTLLAIFTIPFITINLRQKVDIRKDQIYSSMSFIIYLLHWPLLLLYAQSVINIGGIQKMIHLLIYFLATLFISYLLSIYVDTYFETKRKIWLSKQKRLAPTKVAVS